MNNSGLPINTSISQRFRAYLPVVVDVETAGFDPARHALLEVAAIILGMDAAGLLYPQSEHSLHVLPFPDSELDPKALAFTGIDPYHPFRGALAEREALELLFRPIRQAVKETGCKRAILVGHNAAFDLSVLNAAASRCGIKRNPFHPFSTLDTVTLSALAYGETVLAKAAQAAGIVWDEQAAHAALYDAQQTATVFCAVLNRWQLSCR